VAISFRVLLKRALERRRSVSTLLLRQVMLLDLKRFLKLIDSIIIKG
jgi:hypothetical protein